MSFPRKTKTLFFSVGEPSGDQHAARLIAELTRSNPRPSERLSVAPEMTARRIVCRGFGGPEMRRAGCEIDLDLTRHAVVGLIEVLPKLRDFFRFADQAEQVFASGEIDGVVLVDFPGFNWHIAKRAKKYGIPVYYYCPPQVWAWGRWRVRKMRRSVDHVLTVLPIETQFFGDHGIPVTFVGHPFFDAVAEKKLNRETRDQLESRRGGESSPIVAILPGSRDHEVKNNFPIMLETVRRLCRELPQPPRFAVAAYRDSQGLWCRKQLRAEDAELPIDFFVDRTSEILDAAHCAMMVSGSVSLELMARQTPAAVIYRVGRLLHAVGKRVLKVDSVTLPNLMGKRKVFPEFVSVGDPEPAIDFLHETIRAMLTDAFYYKRLVGDLDRLRQQFGKPGASRRASEFLRSEMGLTSETASTVENSGGEEVEPSEQTNRRRAA